MNGLKFLHYSLPKYPYMTEVAPSFTRQLWVRSKLFNLLTRCVCGKAKAYLVCRWPTYLMRKIVRHLTDEIFAEDSDWRLEITLGADDLTIKATAKKKKERQQKDQNLHVIKHFILL